MRVDFGGQIASRAGQKGHREADRRSRGNSISLPTLSTDLRNLQRKYDGKNLCKDRKGGGKTDSGRQGRYSRCDLRTKKASRNDRPSGGEAQSSSPAHSLFGF